METVLYIIAKTVAILLSVIDFAMLLRVLLQFFVDVTTNKIYALCVMLTEPIIFPFRLLFAKFHIGEGLPIDLPFFVGYIAMTFITLFLPVI